MTVAILSIGTELTRGEVINTNASWISASMTEAGFTVNAVETIADDIPRIVESLRRLALSHRFVIVTGGLGPTSDDLTAAAAAEAAGVAIVRDESALLAIRRRVEARGGTMNSAQEKQAEVPVGADILANAEGTAPGFALTLGESVAYFMPGVPREMRRMLTDQVLPRIGPAATGTTHQIRLRTYGKGESAVGLALAGLEEQWPGIVLGYRARLPEVDVKVHASANTQADARDLARKVADEVMARLGDVIYGEGDDDFPHVVGRAVRAKGYRLALAESCTGGLITHLLTSYPASDYLIGGAVTYANSAKTRLLNVAEDTLRGHGAVSAEVAAAMAAGAKRLCEVDIALAVTGIAGPTGGSAEKPVGLVYWAVAHPAGVVVQERIFHGDRREIQTRAAYASMDLLRRVCLGLPLEA